MKVNSINEVNLSFKPILSYFNVNLTQLALKIYLICFRGLRMCPIFRLQYCQLTMKQTWRETDRRQTLIDKFIYLFL